MRGRPHCSDDVMHAGWELGQHSHEAGMSIHHMLKEIDLLGAMLLYACERALIDSAERGDAASGIAVARRLHRAMGLLLLAASKGFTHAYVLDLQDHYRMLRHDLRNPLGTIKSAITLMEDEKVAPEMRNDPRFRRMVSRNATTIDEKIGRQLSDASVLAPAFARQEVSLRDIALSVRRDLREELAERGSTIEVSETLPTVLTDSTSFELVIKSVINALLDSTDAACTIRIDLRQLKERSAVVGVIAEPVAGQPPLIDGGLKFARDLAERTGGKVWTDDSGVCVEVPLSVAQAAQQVPRPS